MSRIFSVILAAAFLSSAEAQPLERVLVPVLAVNLPGLFGSVWHTELTGINEGDFFVPVKSSPDEFCGIPEGCPEQPAQPHQFFAFGSAPFGETPQGAFIFVSSEHAGDVHFHLQAFDKTRRATSFGAAIPVPREEDFTDRAFSLLGVLIDPGFRTTLRVYGLENIPSTAAIRVTRLDRPLQDVNFVTSLGSQFSRLQFTVPSFAVIPDLSSVLPASFLLPGAADAPRVAIQITSLTPGQRLWAFATVTNNSTQQISVFGPQ